MKKILAMFLVLLAAAPQAYPGDGKKIKGNGKIVKNERAAASFDKIATGGSIDIVIDQNGKEGVMVETDENLQDAILAEVDGNSLNIAVKDDYRISPTKLVVYVNCKSLRSISSGGSGDCSTASPISGDDFDISHGGSGDFDLALEVKKLKISTAGSGDYKLKGHVETMVISMAGSGDIDAYALECGNAKISASGSGDVRLRKGTTAKVSSVGSGDVTYE